MPHCPVLLTAASVASSSEEASFVDASGYKFSAKDQKPTKVKSKKAAAKAANGAFAIASHVPSAQNKSGMAGLVPRGVNIEIVSVF